MTKKEIKESRQKRDNLLYKIINKGKKIAISPFNKLDVYMELDNIVWFCPYSKYPINQGSLEEFRDKVINKGFKAKLL